MVYTRTGIYSGTLPRGSNQAAQWWEQFTSGPHAEGEDEFSLAQRLQLSGAPERDVDLARVRDTYQSELDVGTALGRDDEGDRAPGVLTSLAQALDRPRAEVFNFFREVADPDEFDFERWRQRVDDREAFRDLDWANPDEDASLATRGAAGLGRFLGDVLFDPLTYVTGGGSVLGRRVGSQAVASQGRRLAPDALEGASEEVLRRQARRVSPEELGQALEPFAGGRTAQELAAQGVDPLLDLAQRQGLLRGLADEGLARGMGQAYATGGSTRLRRFLTDQESFRPGRPGSGPIAQLDEGVGYNLWRDLPAEFQGGVGFRVPFARFFAATPEGRRLPVRITMPGTGGGRALDRLGFGWLHDTTSAARQALRLSVFGRTLNGMSGMSGKAYAEMLEQTGRRLYLGTEEDFGRAFGRFEGMDQAFRDTRRWSDQIDENLRLGLAEVEDQWGKVARDLGADGNRVRQLFNDYANDPEKYRDILARPEVAGSAEERLGAVAARRFKDMEDDLYGQLRTLMGDDAPGFIQDHAPRMLAREAREEMQALAARKRGGGTRYDPRKERTQFVRRWRRSDDDPNELVPDGWMSVDDINAGRDNPVFNVDAWEAGQDYLRNVRRLARRERLLRAFEQNGIAARTNTATVREWDATRAAEVANQALLRVEESIGGLEGARGQALAELLEESGRSVPRRVRDTWRQVSPGLRQADDGAAVIRGADGTWQARLPDGTVLEPGAAARQADAPSPQAAARDASEAAAAAGPRLPRELAGAKPRYQGGRDARNYVVQFDSDVDRALYIVSQRKKSARDGDYRAWLREQGLSEQDIDTRAQQVREAVRRRAREEPDELRVPPQAEAPAAPAPSAGAVESFHHPNTPGIDDATARQFDEMAQAQRAAPEQAMLRYKQEAVSGGEHPMLLEHVGDLTNRIAKRTGPGDFGRGDILPKLRKTRSILGSRRLGQDVDEQLESAWRYASEQGQTDLSWPEFRRRSRELLAEYADAHRQLPVYTEPQRMARDAAVAVGEQDWATARRLLDELAELAEDPAAWRSANQRRIGEAATEVSPATAPSPRPERFRNAVEVEEYFQGAGRQDDALGETWGSVNQNAEELLQTQDLDAIHDEAVRQLNSLLESGEVLPFTPPAQAASPAARQADEAVEQAATEALPRGFSSWQEAQKAANQALRRQRQLARAEELADLRDLQVQHLAEDGRVLGQMLEEASRFSSVAEQQQAFNDLLETAGRYLDLTGRDLQRTRQVASEYQKTARARGWDSLSSTQQQGVAQARIDELGMFGPEWLKDAITATYRSKTGQSDFAAWVENVWQPTYQAAKAWMTSGRTTGYIARNVVGSLWNAWLYDVQPVHMRRAAVLTTMKANAKRKATNELGRNVPERQMAERARELFREDVTARFGDEAAQVLRVVDAFENHVMGPLSSGARTRGVLQRETESPLQTSSPLDPSIPSEAQTRADRALQAATDNPWIRFWSQRADESETYTRLATFLRGADEYGIDDGGYAAGLGVIATQFDYRDLSGPGMGVVNERNIKNLWTFYTFTRYSVPLQFRSLLYDPGKSARLIRSNDELRHMFGDPEAEEEHVQARWMADRMSWVSRWRTGEGYPLVVGIESPLMDVNRLFLAPGPQQAHDPRRWVNWDEVMSQANPFITQAADTIRGVDSFTRGARPSRQEATGWARMIPGLTSTTPDGDVEMSTAVRSAAETLIPPLGLATRVAPGLLGNERGELRAGSSRLATFGALPVATLDPYQEAAELRQRQTRLQRGLEGEVDNLRARREYIQQMLNVTDDPAYVRDVLQPRHRDLFDLDVWRDRSTLEAQQFIARMRQAGVPEDEIEWAIQRRWPQGFQPESDVERGVRSGNALSAWYQP